MQLASDNEGYDWFDNSVTLKPGLSHLLSVLRICVVGSNAYYLVIKPFSVMALISRVHTRANCRAAQIGCSGAQDGFRKGRISL